MKNLNSTCTAFSTMMNRAADKNNRGLTKSVKKSILGFILLGMILMGASSCSRNMGSGCGAWPVIKPSQNQYRSDTWPIKVKSNKQFANYKGYN